MSEKTPYYHDVVRYQSNMGQSHFILCLAYYSKKPMAGMYIYIYAMQDLCRLAFFFFSNFPPPWPHNLRSMSLEYLIFLQQESGIKVELKE